MMNGWGRVPTEVMREATCSECGREYYRHYTNTKSRFCPECQRERTFEKRRNAYIHKDKVAEGNRFGVTKSVCTVIFDPLPELEGGFKPGARLFICEIRDMLKLGYIEPGFTFEQEGERRIIE